MTNWIEIGKKYVTYGGNETTEIFKTPTMSINSAKYPYAGYLPGTDIMYFWDDDGISSKVGRTDLSLVDEAVSPSERKSDEEVDMDRFDQDMAFMFDVKAEATTARTKFPNTDLAHAMTEEFGEVIKALMDQKQKDKVSSSDIYKECVQAAAMAMRLATEGDPCFPKYKPNGGSK